MAGETYANAPEVEVDGRTLGPAPAHQLVETRVEEAVGHPAVFELRFRDPHGNVLEASGVRIGSTLGVFAHAGDRRRRKLLVLGEVTALEAKGDAEGSFTVVRGMDRGHRLLRGQRVESYCQMTASEVASKLAERVGLERGRFEATSVVHELLTQAGESDWDFLRHLGHASGRRVWVSDGKLNFCAPASADSGPPTSASSAENPLVLQRGYNLLRYNAVVTAAGQVDSAQVRGWDPRTKKALVSRENAAHSRERDIGLQPRDAAKPFGPASDLATAASRRTQAETDDLAKALASDAAAGFAELEADALGNPALQVGVAIALTDVGSPFEGRYTLTHARHVFSPEGGYQTSIMVSARADRMLRAALSGWRSPAPAGPAGPVTEGVMPAVVVDTKDPLQQGRVRLRFPWLSDDYVSDWVRTTQAGGSGGGGLVGAEHDDEVLVGFGQGRLDDPYVLGGLYNGEDKPTSLGGDPVDSRSGAVTRRSWSSRTGNRVELLDVPSGPRGVKMVTGDGNLTLHLDEVETTVAVDSRGKVSVTANEVTVNASESLALSAGGRLSMSGEDIEISGESVSVKGATVNIDGGTECSVSAGLIRLN